MFTDGRCSRLQRQLLISKKDDSAFWFKIITIYSLIESQVNKTAMQEGGSR
jgi:hypothetical protein